MKFYETSAVYAKKRTPYVRTVVVQRNEYHAVYIANVKVIVKMAIQ